MEKKYILALDQGTTSSRAVIFDKECNKICMEQAEFTQYYPKAGWVEHDAEELFNCQLNVMLDAVKKSGINPEEISSIGITNQRETVVLWEKATGKPVCHAIVWQCRRTAEIVDSLVVQGYSGKIRAATGLIPDAYFSGTKIKWLLDNIPGLRLRAENGEILAGTIDTWLVWKLSGGKAHITDYTNASRTMLFNIHTLQWDNELIKLLDIPKCILPDVKDSSCIYTVTDKNVCGFEVPIASVIGDQQAALFGQGCFSKGDAKTTYGTGCFLLMNTGEKPVMSKNKLITTIAIGLNGRIEYALEGSIFMGGAVIKWLRDELKLISSPQDCNEAAQSVPDSNGVIIVPAFTGLGAPYWDPYARGTIVGLTRGANRSHICRAALEGIAFQVKESLECMKQDAGIEINTLKVDGGACASDILMQIQSDLLNADVIRPENVETTITGAAFLAGLATGFWKSKDEILKFWKTDKTFTPAMTEEKRSEMFEKWHKAVIRAQKWAED